MLTISTIPEALATLEKLTGRAWTDSELFDVATANGLSLHAAPPIAANTTVKKWVEAEGLRDVCNLGAGHSALAVLFPWQVGQLWISGETKTSHPSDHDSIEGQYHWFTEPVKVTREQVRIKGDTLQRIVNLWRDAQAWNEEPPVVRPAWMVPAVAERFTPPLAAQAPDSGEAQSNASVKRWTPERLAELAAYRTKYGTAKAAKEFSISAQRIRKMLPTKKSNAGPFTGLGSR